MAGGKTGTLPGHDETSDEVPFVRFRLNRKVEEWHFPGEPLAVFQDLLHVVWSLLTDATLTTPQKAISKLRPNAKKMKIGKNLDLPVVPDFDKVWHAQSAALA